MERTVILPAPAAFQFNGGGRVVKANCRAVLFLSLAAGVLGAQDIQVQSTTVAQLWKLDTPGMDTRTYAPAVQFLGIDASGLGYEGLTLHLFGWGRGDLADASLPGGKKGDGDLTYGYLRYRFATANAEIKAGRFAIHQTGGFEQVDGVSAQTDLKGGFTVSAFAGRPVHYGNLPAADREDYEFQRDFIFGTRVGYRVPKVGEFGVSYLQDGTKTAGDLDQPSLYDFTRKQVGVDLHVAPHARFDLTGRTLFDVASHPETLPGLEDPSRVAEHDYNVSVKVVETVSVSGAFTERNFRAYFAGTTLPSLFRQDERGKFNAYGGKVVWQAMDGLQVTADYRHTRRESYGDANRMGAEVRWLFSEKKLQTGFGFHRVNADDVLAPGAQMASYGLSHNELRAWATYELGRYFASVDGIYQSFDDEANPNLNGKSNAYEVVASLGWKPTENLKISGDLGVGSNPLFRTETRGLVRVEYRFGLGRKGGSK